MSQGMHELPHGTDSFAGPVTRQHLLLVFACVLITVSDGYDVAVASFAMPQMIGQLGLTPAMAGTLLSVSVLGSIIGALASAYLTRRWGRKATLVGSLVWFAACSLATIFARDYRELLLVRFVTGLGLGVPIPLVLAAVGDLVPRRVGGRMLGFIMGGQPLGGVLAGAAAALWASDHGWQVLFLAGAVLPLGILPVVMAASYDVAARPTERTSSQAAEPPAAAKRGYRDLLNDGRGWRTATVMAMGLTGSLLIYFLMNWIPTLLNGMGLTVRQAAVGGTLLNAGTIASVFISGYLMDRFGPLRVAAIGFACAAPLVAALGAPHASLSLLYVLVFSAGFVGIGSQLGFSCVLATGFPPELRGYATSTGYVFARIGAIMGPFVVGLMLQRSLSVANLFLAAAGVSVIAALCALQVMRLERCGQAARTTLAPVTPVTPDSPAGLNA